MKHSSLERRQAAPSSFWLAGQLARHFGWKWLLFRARHRAGMLTGRAARRSPCHEWHELPLAELLHDPKLAEPERHLAYRQEQAPPFFFSPSQRESYAPLLARFDEQADAPPQAAARKIAAGQFTYFGHQAREMGLPPDWHLHPESSQRLEAENHWSRLSDFPTHDIKHVWELSRFGFAWPLVRAYWRDDDPSHAETFWQLVDSWRESNRPNCGVNWKCGQEASFRLMAWCFGLYGFADAPATTARRVAELAQMVGVVAQRIEVNLGYALSQENNHGISEAAGLLTTGLLFPEFRGAVRWRDLGRRHLESQARSLLYEDGTCSQHSFNYQRVMIEVFLWSLRLAELAGEPLSDELRQRVANSADLLYQVQDEAMGGVPCYGHNDGSQVLPLSNCDINDYRPSVQAALAVARKVRRLEDGPWNEALLWLLGTDSKSLPRDTSPRKSLAAREGGYYLLRGDEGFAFTRCARFRHRPAQADLLHVDIWWRGLNIALDPGTFSYHAPPPWEMAFGGTTEHNTVSVDGQNQMLRAGRFLWLPWARGTAGEISNSAGGQLACWEGMHDGYRRLDAGLLHHRAILGLPHDHWLVLDRIAGSRAHLLRLHWLLVDLPHQWRPEEGHIELTTPAGPYHVRVAAMGSSPELSLVRAEEGSTRGWRARYYGQREPALSLAACQQSQDGQFATLLGPSGARLELASGQIRVTGDGWQATVQTAVDPPVAKRDEGVDRLVRHIALEGPIRDELGGES